MKSAKSTVIENAMKIDPDKMPSPSLRNLHLLEAIGSQGRPLTAAELNETLNLPKPTLHRLIGQLEDEGFLIRNVDGKSYLPGPRYRVMALGATRAQMAQLPTHEALVLLNEKIGETCNLSIPDGDAMIYIDRVETKWPLRIALTVGSRVPLHATSAGKVALSMLAPEVLENYLAAGTKHAYTDKTIIKPAPLKKEIERVRKERFSTDDEEFVVGMIAVGVPIVDRNGNFRATLSFHAPEQRLKLSDGLGHLPAMQETARMLGDRL